MHDRELLVFAAPWDATLRRFFHLWLITLSLLFVTASCQSRTAGCDQRGHCYVRASAPAGGDGSDWERAFRVLPAQLTRGLTYYVAAGTYPGHLFADPDRGADYITIQAATPTNHGTDRGWKQEYVGEAVFNTADGARTGDIFTFQTDYYIVDGAYRSNFTGAGAQGWNEAGGYGFRVDNRAKVACNADIALGENTRSVPMPVHHISIRFLEVDGSHESVTKGCREDGFAALWGSHDYSLQDSYVHDTGLTILLLRGEHANCAGASGHVSCGPPHKGYGDGSHIQISGNYFARNFSDPEQHASGCSCSEGLHDLTIANNYWQDINGTGIITTASGADWNNGNGSNGPWYIHGNVAFETSCVVFSGVKNHGIAAFFYKWDTTFTQPIYIANNTLSNFPGECNSGSGVLLNDGAYPAPAGEIFVQNNLWDRAARIDIQNACSESAGYASCSAVHWSHNAYFASPDDSGANDSDTHVQISPAPALFMTQQGRSFMLASHTKGGASTAALMGSNETDPRGVQRGVKGMWDRGAYQVDIPSNRPGS